MPFWTTINSILTESRYYGHFYEIFMFWLYEKNHPGKAEDPIHFKRDVFYSYIPKTGWFFDTFTMIRMRIPT